ncbi:MAG: hypothetical protein B7C24_15400 [Bacteroidetes bacterium 4572_77]|nr:MAG: hypothetical protein B7C24_15400 [Bacteroidetes bacterium 4572_77]
MKNVVCLLICFVLLMESSLSAEGLPDTTIYLHQVNINSNIVQNLSTGNKIDKIPSRTMESFQQNSLKDLLQNHSNLNIKSYGVSGISNISMRGAMSHHTAILWNGINLQDPMNAAVNPALFPVGLVNEIEIQYGGSGALYGSGAIGGVISMKKNLSFNKGLVSDIALGMSSFNHYNGQLKLEYGGDKYAGSLLYFCDQSANDFPYKNTQKFGHPMEKQENAASLVQGLSQDNSFILNESQKINTHLWLQKSRRNIASNMTISGAENYQLDESLRFSSDWIKYGKVTTLMAQMAFLHQKMNYEDPVAQLSAIHQSNSFIAQFESNIQLPYNQLINYGMHERLDWAKSDNYLSLKQQNTLAFFASYKKGFLQQKGHVLFSLREELFGQKFNPITPALAIEYELLKKLTLKGKISKTYRNPTFNDLYWEGGFAYGNQDLKAESAWVQDLGLLWEANVGYYHSALEITLFNSKMHELIVWQPDSVGKWHPVNKKKVWSRGVEVQHSNDFIFSRITTGFQWFYTYNPSTLEEGGSCHGNQLIYAPIHQAKIKYYFLFKDWSFNLDYQWNGQRYIKEDNTDYLSAYGLFNMYLNAHLPIKKQKIFFQLSINNILNEVYQSVENYAMPMRSFQLTLRYHFVLSPDRI